MLPPAVILAGLVERLDARQKVALNEVLVAKNESTIDLAVRVRQSGSTCDKIAMVAQGQVLGLLVVVDHLTVQKAVERGVCLEWETRLDLTHLGTVDRILVGGSSVAACHQMREELVLLFPVTKQVPYDVEKISVFLARPLATTLPSPQSSLRLSRQSSLKTRAPLPQIILRNLVLSISLRLPKTTPRILDSTLLELQRRDGEVGIRHAQVKVHLSRVHTATSSIGVVILLVDIHADCVLLALQNLACVVGRLGRARESDLDVDVLVVERACRKGRGLKLVFVWTLSPRRILTETPLSFFRMT